MRLLKWLMLVCLLALVSMVNAEDEPEWPPDPEAIFAEVITWEVVEEQPTIVVPAIISPTPTTPTPPVDVDFLQSLVSGSWYDITMTLSPDGEWLVFSGRDIQHEPPQYEVFAYHIEYDRLHSLGIIPSEYNYQHIIRYKDQWVSDELGLLESYWFTNMRGNRHYVFDVTQPDSLQYAFSRLESNVNFIDRLSRYIALHSASYNGAVGGWGTTPDAHRPCTLIIYDAAGLRRQELGYDCLPLNFDPGSLYFAQAFIGWETIYYLVVDEADNSQTSIYRLNTSSADLPEPLFTGQVRNILSISAHYFVLLMDNDDPSIYQYKVALVDRSNGTIRYLTERLNVQTDQDIHWLDPSTLLIAERVRWQGDRQIIRLTISDDGMVEVDATSDYPSYPLYDDFAEQTTTSGDYWLIRSEYRVVNLRTFTDIRPLQDGIADMYGIALFLSRDSVLTVRVTHPNDDSLYVRYRINLME